MAIQSNLRWLPKEDKRGEGRSIIVVVIVSYTQDVLSVETMFG